MHNFTPNRHYKKKPTGLIRLLILFLFLGFSTTIFSQGINTGVTFNWADNQSNNDDPATIATITINGFDYTTFVVPSSYELTSVGPSGHSENVINKNGSEIVSGSDSSNWSDEAILAYQSLNLNHYFESYNNGDDFCEDSSKVNTTNSQVQTIRYNPGIPSNADGILAVTERAGNNCLYVEMYGTPVGGGAEQLLGTTFIRNGNRMGSAGPQAPPNTATSDYWNSGRVNDNGSAIGIAMYELSSIAPTGSIITSIKYIGATQDHGDGKFFLLQTYAIDDTFDTDFEKVFNGNVATNDNTPVGSVYTENSSPSNGSLSVNTDGSFSYIPNAGFIGTDTFTVQVCLPAPNQSVCDTSTVSITVNPSPSELSINDASAVEGDNLVFTITNPSPANQPIVINLAYSNNTTTNADYNGPTTVTLPANASSVSFNVAAIDDDWVEATQQNFSINISTSSSLATVDDGEGIGTIIDTDIAYVTGGNYDITEGGTIQYRLFLSTDTNSSGQQYVGIEESYNIDFNVLEDATSTHPATNGLDFNGFNTTVSFPRNSAAGTEIFIPIPTIDDELVESSEEFHGIKSRNSAEATKYGSGPSRVGINTEKSALRIHDNDVAIIIVESLMVKEDVGSIPYTFTLDGTTQNPFNINYTLSNGSAIQPSDYTGNSATLTFSGTDRQILTENFSINDDTVAENTEQFFVSPSYTGTAPLFANALAPNIIFSLSNPIIIIEDNDNDNDNDGIDDITDLDDDNDGITDANEAEECINDDYFAWEFNSPSGTKTNDFVQNPAITNWLTSNISNVSVGSGLNSATPGSELQLTSLSSDNYVDARQQSEYVEVSFTTASNLISPTIERMGLNWYRNSDGTTVGNAYDAAIAISKDNFATSVLLNSDIRIHYPSDGISEFFDLTPIGVKFNLEENTTYTVRIYAYNQQNDGNVSYSVFDDFAVRVSSCLEQNTDGDSLPDHFDNDSDGDACVDAIEAGHTDPDADGYLGNSPVSVDATGLVTGQGGYTGNHSRVITPNQIVSVTTQPVDAIVLNNGSTSFTGAFSGTGLTYQWLVSTDNGASWNAITNGGIYSGATTTTLNLTNITTTYNSYEYQLVATDSENLCSPETSTNKATLYVAPELSINNASAIEGNAITFTITASNTIPQDIALDLTYTNNTTINSDYSGPTNLILSANSTTVTFDVATIDDSFIEPTETFNVILSHNDGIATFTDNTGIGTITDNDNAAPGDGIAFSNATYSTLEGDATSENVTLSFEVTYTGDIPAGETVSVDYQTAEGSATYANDFTENNGTLQFTNSSKSQSVAIEVTEDTVIESDENFTVLLNNISTANGFVTGFVDGATSNTATATIINDDNAAPGDGIAFSNATYSTLEGDATSENVTLSFEVTYTGDIPAGETVSVDYQTAEGSATYANDFTQNNGTLQFTNSSKSQSVAIEITEDTVIESDENFTVLLNNISTANGFVTGFVDGTTSNTATATIINDDNAAPGDGIAFSNATYSTLEGDATSENVTLSFEVTYTGDIPAGETVSVDYQTAEGSATYANDFTQNNGTLQFTNSSKSQSVAIEVTEDTVIESDENFTVLLNNISTANGFVTGFVDGATSNTATATIINDDNAAPGDGIAFSNATYSTLEGDATSENVTLSFEVTYTGDIPAGETVSVDYQTAEGSATYANDFTQNNGTLQFTNSSKSQSVAIEITEDTVIESDENFTVLLNNISTANGFVTGFVDGTTSNTATATIINDDNAAPGDGIAFSNATYSTLEGDATSENVTLSFEVTYTGDIPAGETVSVDYQTAEGSATYANDFTQNNGTLQFTNSSKSQSVAIEVTEDTVIESDENFTVLLNNISTANGFVTGFVDGATSNTATATIINDDNAAPGDGIAFSNATYSTLEGDATSDNVTLSFEVTYTGDIPAGETVSVDYQTAEGSATYANDFTQNNGTLQFTNSSKSQSVAIEITEDTVIESDENFTFLLNNISTANGFVTGFVDGTTSNTATATIINDDNAAPGDGIAFSNATYSTLEGDATSENVTLSFEVTYTGDIPAGETVSVDYQTAEGSATYANDFTQNNGTLQFTNSSKSQSVAIEITEDTVIESDENFTFLLNNISTANGFVTGFVDGTTSNTATATIINDDSDSSLGVQFDVTSIDVNEDAGTVSLNVVLNADVQDEFTVEFYTTNGTAVDGLDYSGIAQNTQTVTFGSTNNNTQVITIAIIDDIAIENVENFSVILTNISTDVVNILANDTANVNIIDNDGNENYPEDITIESCDTIPDAEDITSNSTCLITVTYSENIEGQDDDCAIEYTITRTWVITDCVGNVRTHIQVITIEDTVAPTFVENIPQDITVACNEVPDAAILTAVDTCDTDIDVVFEETATNDRNCATGYVITRTWTASDCAGNTTTTTQTITVPPTGPITSSPYDKEVTIICGDEIPDVPQLTFSGGCDNFDVVFSEEIQNASDTTNDYMIIRSWIVTDSCNNTETFEQIIFVMQPQLEEVFIDICVEDDAIDLINFLPAGFDTNGQFVLISGNTTIEGSIFNPADLEIDEYKIEYSSTDGTCKYYVDFTIITNSDCVTCDASKIITSKAVTPNNDGRNDTFEITGVEYCNYTFDVMIFNRWGNKVYEGKDYQNDWGGFAPNKSFGSSTHLPTGTYYFIININGSDLEPLNGYIYVSTE
ncbi:gliding motility-associated C-terminal domain-containing protein [Cellulophaga sp. HaHaR_3_176]|uniref:Calx-beta domain-containing protein n=1 Tax=Cellulophaga sp. HaHaR_3_176 TaxID=1942464 RepID=UPI001C1F8E92|nr:Calx-beta domain-containing protein [Cellulophaga sp. HaHaR_3_176]QWX84309.1 gliding motility-associated C-terminal domain-containing protein [Cellulophaga sp. HaHaR_3_176]